MQHEGTVVDVVIVVAGTDLVTALLHTAIIHHLNRLYKALLGTQQ
jgi:hypothetical protein